MGAFEGLYKRCKLVIRCRLSIQHLNTHTGAFSCTQSLLNCTVAFHQKSYSLNCENKKATLLFLVLLISIFKTPGVYDNIAT